MPFQAPITLTSGAIPRNGTCPILNLSLARRFGDFGSKHGQIDLRPKQSVSAVGRSATRPAVFSISNSRPLDLNLLGLRVELDNCANGPVVLDITANPAGGLLGQLLCGLANLLQGDPTPQILVVLQKIAAERTKSA